MANVADYFVVRDSSFTLDPGSAQSSAWHFERSFDLAPDVLLSGRMILQYVCVYPKSFTSARVRFLLNGDKIAERLGPTTHGIHTGVAVGVHETFAANLARHGQNLFRVELFGGDGTVALSDIVVWFQAQI